MHKGSVEEVPQAQIGVSSFKRGDDMWERRILSCSWKRFGEEGM
jgi:hypothetical protein